MESNPPTFLELNFL